MICHTSVPILFLHIEVEQFKGWMISISYEYIFLNNNVQSRLLLSPIIRSFLLHSDTEYSPIELPVSHLFQNLEQSVAFRTTTLFTIGWQPVHNFLLMKIKITGCGIIHFVCTFCMKCQKICSICSLPWC